MNPPHPGTLVVISGPSGAGKSTVVRRLLELCGLPLALSVSATTRKPRPGEVDGVEYQFLEFEEFQAKRDAGEFLEFAEVYGQGKWYGTLRRPVEESQAQGNIVLLEIDVSGALQVIKRFPNAITIFVHPGSLEILEQRLRGRDTEDESSIQRRLEVARIEMETAHQYTYSIQNDDIDTAANEICQILTTFGEKRTCTKN